ncbi:MAG: family 43 glycosylhydrolase [Bacilli bacterium]|jgi:beta-xylosidase|nr:family 43 glycosylhydrolase [Bacilli bacterium]
MLAKLKKSLLVITATMATLAVATVVSGCKKVEEEDALTGVGRHQLDLSYENYYVEFDVNFKEDGESGIFFNTNMQKQKGLYLYFNSKKDCIGIYELPLIPPDPLMVERGPWTKENYIAWKKVTIETGRWYKVQLYVYNEFIRVWFNENEYDLDPYFKFDLNIGNQYHGTELILNFGDNGEAKFRNITIAESEPIPTENTYTNYLIQALSDPFVLLDNGTYYLYGNNVGDPSCFYVFTSPDLVHWTKSTHKIISGDGSVYGTYFRSPRIIKAKNNKYYLFFNAKQGPNDDFVQTYAVAENPAGPFSNPGFRFYLNGLYIGARPIYDEITKKYYMVITYCSQGNHVALMELTLNEDGEFEADLSTAQKLISPAEEWELNGGGVAEGGYIFHHNGYYYCMYTGGSYDSAYGEGYAVSENIYGPYVKYENNPVLFATRCAWGNGDAAITTSPDGTKFYFAYFRHSSNTVVRPLNLCIDELKFVKNANGGADILVVRGPTVSPQPIPDFS